MNMTTNKQINKKDLLIEIGTEELPPKALQFLSQAFTQGIISGLDNSNITFRSYKSFSTPRRLALIVNDTDTAQPDENVVRKGPLVKSMYDSEGKPSKAALGFARSNGVNLDTLEKEETPKGLCLVYRSVKIGKQTKELIPEIITQSLNNLPIPKRMRWGANRSEFVRPIHWLLILLGSKVIDCEILGLKAGNTTRGHRFHANRKLIISHPTEYEQKLHHEGKVIANFDNRRETIRTQVEQVASSINGQAVIDNQLLDEVTALNEWPVTISGQFDVEFLTVPSEVLISSMKVHQKYFHVINNEKKLINFFITVTNIESQETHHIIEGNERVIRARLSDAKFFYEKDCKTTLNIFREKLKSVVFQTQLGSIYNKTERIARLAAFIVKTENGDTQLAERAGLLSKSDLVSEMVQEFPELQGIMGKYYAENNGENDTVSTTLYEQYMPRFAGDQLPSTLISCAVSIADKLDTITGIFGINELPTGNKDPFSLRRASIGILRIIVDKKLNFDLKELTQTAISGYQEQNIALPAISGLSSKVVDYILQRFDSVYYDEGIAVEIINSVKQLSPTKPFDFDLRVKAIAKFDKMPEARALTSANKRVSNILTKVEDTNIPDKLNESLLTEDAEIYLAKAIDSKKQEIEPIVKKREYTLAMEKLATLKEPIDVFFDQVFVNAEDQLIRINRYTLLKQLRNLFLQVADISQLSKK